MANHTHETETVIRHRWRLRAPTDHGELFKTLYAARAELAVMYEKSEADISDDELTVEIGDDEVWLVHEQAKRK